MARKLPTPASHVNNLVWHQRHLRPELEPRLAANGDVFPYLLVNIGSGVSMLKVPLAMCHARVAATQSYCGCQIAALTAPCLMHRDCSTPVDGSITSLVQVSSATQAERVSGSALGGGSFAGLCRLLTGVRSFDEMLRLAAQGDNKKVGPLRRVSSLWVDVAAGAGIEASGRWACKYGGALAADWRS